MLLVLVRERLQRLMVQHSFLRCGESLLWLGVVLLLSFS